MFVLQSRFRFVCYSRGEGADASKGSAAGRALQTGLERCARLCREPYTGPNHFRYIAWILSFISYLQVGFLWPDRLYLNDPDPVEGMDAESTFGGHFRFLLSLDPRLGGLSGN